jgi:predicted membrane protein
MTNDQFNSNPKKKNDRLLLGALVIGAGILLLFRNLGFWFPSFLFSWPMILIAVGLFIGVRDKFSNNGWWIVMAIGGFFLLRREFDYFDLGDFFWPLLILAIGISILLGKGGRRRRWLDNNDDNQSTTTNFSTMGTTANAETGSTNKEDVIDAAAIFGSVKKNMYSKNFKGGEVVTVFGGSEINLMHADFTGEIKLEIVNIFGGTTLFVPAHWQIRSEAAAILGAIEDKRREPAAIQQDKVLIIEGTVIFGGIDIKSA